MWKGILYGRYLILKGMVVKIGDGKTIFCQDDAGNTINLVEFIHHHRGHGITINDNI